MKREDIWRTLRKRVRKPEFRHPAFIPTYSATVSPPTSSGGDGPATLQELLGHSSIATTEKYLHFDLELRDVYDKAHPRRRHPFFTEEE